MTNHELQTCIGQTTDEHSTHEKCLQITALANAGVATCNSIVTGQDIPADLQGLLEVISRLAGEVQASIEEASAHQI